MLYRMFCVRPKLFLPFTPQVPWLIDIINDRLMTFYGVLFRCILCWSFYSRMN